MYEKILMAYDGSREGHVALFECADIAHLLHSEVHLLAVMGMPSGLFLAEGFIPEKLVEDEQKRTQEILDEGIRALAERGYNVQGHFATGEPVEEICRVARELKVNLIVVGHRQRHSFAERWWRGSVGASLMEHSPCSILIAVIR
ncbi:MAG TPA: universal stress protein [Burkholderiales bacterium]|nr:universal stress protein [Burkholderiales bacterium]